MKLSTNVTTLPYPDVESIKLKELELKHELKLYEMDKHYFSNLQKQKDDIGERLKDDISDYSRNLLINLLHEIEDEILGYELDDSKVRNLQREIEFLKSKENKAYQIG